MNGPIRIGIVGSRFAARFHYEAYRRVTGVKVNLVGVTSTTKEHRAASDVVAVLCAAYVSAERKGGEVEVPLDPTL